jgi:hypothetical protein
MKFYQPTSYLAKNEKGDMLADSHNNLEKWKNYFFSAFEGTYFGLVMLGMETLSRVRWYVWRN